MKTSHCGIGVLTVASALGLLGCENWRSQTLRHNQDNESNINSKLTDVDASIPKGERAGLSNGTWSRQAQEIESHFGK